MSSPREVTVLSASLGLGDTERMVDSAAAAGAAASLAHVARSAGLILVPQVMQIGASADLPWNFSISSAVDPTPSTGLARAAPEPDLSTGSDVVAGLLGGLLGELGGLGETFELV